MTHRTATKAKLAQMGQCVSEGFTTAVDNGNETIAAMFEVLDSVKTLKPYCPRELFNALITKLDRVFYLVTNTTETCDVLGRKIEHIAQDLKHYR